jgi:NADH-quinone oxidoreductase subunit E
MRGVLYAAWEIVLLLLTAGIIGLALGWVLTKWTIGRRAVRAEHDANTQKAIARSLREQNDSLQHELARARAALADQEAELRRVRRGPGAAIPVADAVDAIAARTAGDEPCHDDDLKLINGIGPKLEGLLKDMGITSYAQIARLDGADIAIVAAALGSNAERIECDDWVGGAARLHLENYGEPA